MLRGDLNQPDFRNWERFCHLLFSPLGQAAVLGIVGFVTGFVFALQRMPYANQGPLVAFFIGPMFAAIGLALGLLRQWLRVPLSFSALLLAVSCVAGGMVVYALCEPEDRWETDLVHGRVSACVPAASFLDEAVTDWEQSIAINPDKTVLASWRSDLEKTLRDASGQVAIIQVDRTRSIYVSRHEADRGREYAQPWISKAESAKYFVRGDECQLLAKAGSVTFRVELSEWPEHERLPPDDAARALNLHLYAPVPEAYRKWESP